MQLISVRTSREHCQTYAKQPKQCKCEHAEVCSEYVHTRQQQSTMARVHSLLLIAATLVAASCCLQSVGAEEDYSDIDFGCMIDAGSTGSRIHIFSW